MPVRLVLERERRQTRPRVALKQTSRDARRDEGVVAGATVASPDASLVINIIVAVAFVIVVVVAGEPDVALIFAILLLLLLEGTAVPVVGVAREAAAHAEVEVAVVVAVVVVGVVQAGGAAAPPRARVLDRVAGRELALVVQRPARIGLELRLHESRRRARASQRAARRTRIVAARVRARSGLGLVADVRVRVRLFLSLLHVRARGDAGERVAQPGDVPEVPRARRPARRLHRARRLRHDAHDVAPASLLLLEEVRQQRRVPPLQHVAAHPLDVVVQEVVERVPPEQLHAQGKRAGGDDGLRRRLAPRAHQRRHEVHNLDALQAEGRSHLPPRGLLRGRVSRQI